MQEGQFQARTSWSIVIDIDGEFWYIAISEIITILFLSIFTPFVVLLDLYPWPHLPPHPHPTKKKEKNDIKNDIKKQKTQNTHKNRKKRHKNLSLKFFDVIQVWVPHYAHGIQKTILFRLFLKHTCICLYLLHF